MEEHDDWELGDEADPIPCPRCGKPNRPGLHYCAICGSPLADEREGDSGSLRGLGEAMGGRRTYREPERHPLRAWVVAVVLLLVVVVLLTWLQTREEPFRLEDWTTAARPTPIPTPPPLPPTPIATHVSAPTKRPQPSATPEPTAVRTVLPTAQPTPAHRRPTPAPRPPTPVATKRPPAPAPTPAPADAVAPPVRPQVEATEKPSVGTDLQQATQAYRQALDVHNARVDEYNALADEIQRRNAWDDSEASVELRRRLDRAREAVESARVQAEMLRARMESIRARYR